MLACVVDFGGLPDNLLIFKRSIYSRVTAKGVASLVEYSRNGVPCQFIEYRYNNGDNEVVILHQTLLSNYTEFISALECEDDFDLERVYRGEYLVLSFCVGRNLLLSFDDLIDFSFGIDTDDDTILSDFGVKEGVIYG